MTAKVLKFTGLKVAKTLKPMKKKARKLKLKATQVRSASGPVKSSDVLATKGMIAELQSKMSHQFAEARLRTDAQFDGVRSEMQDIRSDIHDIRSDIHDIRADIQKVQAEVQKVLAAVHEIGLRVEEQNARNIYVLDGHTNLHDRLSTLEKKASESDV